MKKLTTMEVAEHLNAARSTVNLWCRQGKFPNAEWVKIPMAQGGYWLVPESDLKNFTRPKLGRRKKAA
ncbi:MAG TPA: helix-turn-helix domain-containing protein [Pyrinomonadaceae bacterium]|jgi:predicted site-specific integrase-resolvase